MEVKVLGIVLGECADWDQVGDTGIMFYAFKPKLVGIPEGNLFIDMETGDLQISSEDTNAVRMHVPAYGFLKQTVEV